MDKQPKDKPSWMGAEPRDAAETGSRKRPRSDSKESADSGSTHSSQADMRAGKVTSMLISSSMVGGVPVVSFNTNVADRADTVLIGQGDHVTAYLAIIQTMVSFCSTHLDVCRDKLVGFADKLLPGDLCPQYKQSVTYDHKARMDLEAFVNGSAVPEDRHRFSKVTRFAMESKKALLAESLCKYAKKIIEAYQKMPSTTAYSIGRINKKPGEGAKVKSASRALYTLGIFQQIANGSVALSKEELLAGLAPRNQQDSSDTEDAHILRYGLNAFYSGKGESVFNELSAINSESGDAITSFANGILKDLMNTKKLAGFIGDLFDYYREVHFSKEADVDALEDHFGEDCDIQEGDDNYVVERQNKVELKKIVKRHFDVIDALCPGVEMSEAKNGFIESIVAQKMGWASKIESMSAFQEECGVTGVPVASVGFGRG